MVPMPNAGPVWKVLRETTDFTRPPEWTQMDIRGFAGSDFVKEKTVSFKGDPGNVRRIVEGGIALVRRCSQLIGAGDFEGAYGYTDLGLRGCMNLKKFVGEHQRAAQANHGPALGFMVYQFAYVYADDEVRKKSNTATEGWPRLTEKSNRRGRVIGFWIHDRAANTGRRGALWIAEEHGDYRIAKFDFWRP